MAQMSAISEGLQKTGTARPLEPTVPMSMNDKGKGIARRHMDPLQGIPRKRTQSDKLGQSERCLALGLLEQISNRSHRYHS